MNPTPEAKMLLNHLFRGATFSVRVLDGLAECKYVEKNFKTDEEKFEALYHILSRLRTRIFQPELF